MQGKYFHEQTGLQLEGVFPGFQTELCLQQIRNSTFTLNRTATSLKLDRNFT